MNFKYYIGVDVSKHTLDFTLLLEGNFVVHQRIDNEKSAIQAWLKTIMAEHRAGGRKTLFCVENSGTYTGILLKELTRRKVPIWLETPLQINLSLGLHRGKSDKIDSMRIAQYAYIYRKKATFWHMPRPIIEQLKQLRTLRERLIEVHRKLRGEMRELQGFVAKGISDSIQCHCVGSITAVAEDLVKVEQTMKCLIEGDERLNQLYTWLVSITGISRVIATEMLIATNEFKNFTSPKKFACHCGVVPFRYTSGVSLQSRAMVSKRANQRMKRLLHMSALSALRAEGEFKVYYQRKVLEGHAKMKVVNAIRNKLILRAFACVREERCYVK